eukprot:jgi/Hompol1/5901/HPOL_000337-RA
MERAAGAEERRWTKEEARRIKEEYRQLQERIHRARTSGIVDNESKRDQNRYRELKEAIRDEAQTPAGDLLTPISATTTGGDSISLQTQAHKALDRLAALRREAGKSSDVSKMSIHQIKSEKTAVKSELAKLKAYYSGVLINGERIKMSPEEKKIMKDMFAYYCDLKARHEKQASSSPGPNTPFTVTSTPITPAIFSASNDTKEQMGQSDEARYRALRHEKKRLQIHLHEYQTAFQKQHGRAAQTTEDWAPVKAEYRQYKALRRELEEAQRKAH